MVDWWSLGILLYEIVVGAPPYNDRNHLKVIADIMKKPFIAKDYFSK
jgi:serine/threonine protein kinase